MSIRSPWRLLRGEGGSSLLETALILPVFLLALAGAVDFGRGYYAAIEVTSAAEAGALYGVLNPTDTAGMQKAAVLDAKDVPGLKATASYGCECSGGDHISVSCTSAPTTCTYTVVNYVQINTTATYTPILKFPGIASSFPLAGEARMRGGR